MYGHYSLRYLCTLFGKSRQAYYEQTHTIEKQGLTNTFVLKLVEEIRRDLPRCGVSKLQHLLREPFALHGIKMGRDALYELLGNHGYLIRQRRRRPYCTDSGHHYKKYPNLIKDMELTRSGRLWVSDITYLRMAEGRFCYLSLITDAYSRKIVGYRLHPTLHSQGVIDALQMAAGGSKNWEGLVHHSDRGSQYCCHEYVKKLESYKIRISMTEKGDPYENAIAERVNGILKEEFLLNRKFASYEEASAAVDDAIKKYNHLRPHASCDYLTPVMAHEQNGVLRKRWKNSASMPAGGCAF